ncbi:hypothetical protein ACFWFI_19615 [Streptomyces sp. NPDC060209]|uniref:hypothetical protein n=1 Tax=Streptomyces sp. NPDC060209 TaxID=3347073 RepID=UPI00366772EA
MTQDTDPMTVSQTIRTRRSIRHRLPDPAADRQLSELPDLAPKAPSSWNGQARSVVAAARSWRDLHLATPLQVGRPAETRARPGRPTRSRQVFTGRYGRLEGGAR